MAQETMAALYWNEQASLDIVSYVFFNRDMLVGFSFDCDLPYNDGARPIRFDAGENVAEYFGTHEPGLGTAGATPITSCPIFRLVIFPST